MKKKFFFCISAALVMLSFSLFLFAQDETSTTPQTQETVAAQAPAPVLEVADCAVCEEVENREPVNKKESFTSTVGKIYFWTKIVGAQEPTQIKHVWYLEGTQVADVNLNIAYPAHRTWSAKTILPEMTGNWSVEVIDAQGKVLKKVSFSVNAQPETPAAPEQPTEQQE